jgi:hypothetical protein
MEDIRYLIRITFKASQPCRIAKNACGKCLLLWNASFHAFLLFTQTQHSHLEPVGFAVHLELMEVLHDDVPCAGSSYN